MTNALLTVQDIRKNYGKFQALKGVSFQVQEGELFGLLGPNGAGKTTLMSILSCLMSPSSGSVSLGDKLVNRSDLSIRHLIGIVPQELALYGELTARENLRFVGQLYELPREEVRKREDEVLELIGLSDRANHHAGNFSGGMKRRLNLGMALMHRPKLLLLDEPTTGVDPQSRNHIFEGVRRLNAEGLTVVYTSHYMEEVQALCPRIGIMDHGEVIACDTLSELLRQLPGMIRFRVAQSSSTLTERLTQLSGALKVRERSDNEIELDCHDVKLMLSQLLALLNELHAELVSLELEEPNLERVFLHLTGHRLRD